MQPAAPRSGTGLPTARERAQLRCLDIVEDDLRGSGGAYDLADIQILLHGASRQAVDKQVRSGSLLALPGPDKQHFFPVVQFGGDGRPVHGLSAVREALPTDDAWAILHFLVNAHSSLNGERPIDLMKRGDIEPVLAAARGLGNQGA